MFDDIEEIIMNIEMKIFEQIKSWNCKLKLKTNGFYRKRYFSILKYGISKTTY